MDKSDRVLDYWFGAPGTEEHGLHREMWYRGGPEIDAEISEQFLTLYERAATGELSQWRESYRPCLALILLLDQFPRNMFRGKPKSFYTDAEALNTARHAIEQGYDRELNLNFQQFFYLPFEHSEDIADQRRSVELFLAGAEDERKELTIGYAVKHLEIIQQFGRFPHRNLILGRDSTVEEIKFLEDGGEDVQFGTQRNQDAKGSSPD